MVPKLKTKSKKKKILEPETLEDSSAIISYAKSLFKSADALRKNIDAAEYKHPILGLIFLKYISDAFDERRQELIAQKDQGADPEERSEYRSAKVFWVPKDARWSHIQKYAKNPEIGKILDTAMEALEHDNDSLLGVLPKTYGSPKLDKASLGRLVDLFSNIPIGGKKNHTRDVLGRIYEYFLGEFASNEGKKGGQFYTPSVIVNLLVTMTAPTNGRVYEPCAGSGGMIVQSESFMETNNGELSFYGQESNQTTWRLCKMNLAIRGIDADIRWNNEGSFIRDEHKDLRADYILANPPFNDGDWSGEKLTEDERWKYGIPPPSNANFAWMQHIIHHLSKKGVAGVVMSNGSLNSDKNNENVIRAELVKNDLVDCIVLLPSKLFYSVSLSATLWFFAKNKKSKFGDRREKTLFIDARKMGEMLPGDKTHRILTSDDIEYIAKTYHAWKGEPNSGTYNDKIGFCKSVTKDKIESEDFVLDSSVYVGYKEKKSTIPYEKTMKELSESYSESLKKSNSIDKENQTMFKDLGFNI